MEDATAILQNYAPYSPHSPCHEEGWEGCSIQWSGGGVGISTPFNKNVHLIVFSFFLVSHQTGWTALVCRLLEKLAKNR